MKSFLIRCSIFLALIASSAAQIVVSDSRINGTADHVFVWGNSGEPTSIARSSLISGYTYSGAGAVTITPASGQDFTVGIAGAGRTLLGGTALINRTDTTGTGIRLEISATSSGANANGGLRISSSTAINLAGYKTTDFKLKSDGSGNFYGAIDFNNDGTTSVVEVLGWNKSGPWTMLGFRSYSATGGIGYGTGAGGAVTQGTSKSTGVTLNKICGAITTHNAALAAGATVSFTVTNSTVVATDIIPPPTIASGATAGAYDITVDAVAAGSFRISITNRSGGSLGEALVLNFAVIKAVAN